jgi:acyl phosphate:glycerol-3-phosphate acyltransferase
LFFVVRRRLMLNIIASLVLTAIVAYLWGSLPSGYWMGKLLRGRDFDIREHGSRKTGATNVQRLLGTVPALIVFVLDISKGVGPVLLATYIPLFQVEGWGVLVAGLSALLGHCFPIFINFKGGRGVLTGAGAVLVISPFTFFVGMFAAFSTIGISRYVSLGSLIGSLTILLCGVSFYLLGLTSRAPFFAHLTLAQVLYLVIAPILITVFHADNIVRLIHGTERKLGGGTSVQAQRRPQFDPGKVVLTRLAQNEPLITALERLPQHGPLKIVLERLHHLG